MQTSIAKTTQTLPLKSALLAELGDPHICPPAIAHEILDRMTQPGLAVDLVYTDEAGEWLWAIIDANPVKTSGLWITAYPTREMAKQLCAEMGWPVAHICDPYKRRRREMES